MRSGDFAASPALHSGPDNIQEPVPGNYSLFYHYCYRVTARSERSVPGSREKINRAIFPRNEGIAEVCRIDL